eukprot:scaffold45455_cov34-Phaeocystis_antarctica.AAC.2
MVMVKGRVRVRLGLGLARRGIPAARRASPGARRAGPVTLAPDEGGCVEVSERCAAPTRGDS